MLVIIMMMMMIIIKTIIITMIAIIFTLVAIIIIIIIIIIMVILIIITIKVKIRTTVMITSTRNGYLFPYILFCQRMFFYLVFVGLIPLSSLLKKLVGCSKCFALNKTVLFVHN